MAERWTERDIPDLTGDVFVVTGANGGLGRETSRALAAKGATVVMGCRTEAKAREAMAAIEREVPGARLEFVALDLADLDRVEAFAAEVAQAHPRLRGIVNNAGVMAVPYTRTKQGFELQMGTNHFGHFALTGRLLPTLRDGARVVTVTSLMHQAGWIHFEDLDWEHGYEKWQAYGQTKLANLLFAYELQRRLVAAKRAVVSVAAHPGYVDTDLQSAGQRQAGQKLRARLFGFASRVAGQDPRAGALPILYAATAAEVQGGDFYGPGTLQLWGAPKPVQSNARSHDREVAARLWDVSEDRTGVTYAF